MRKHSPGPAAATDHQGANQAAVQILSREADDTSVCVCVRNVATAVRVGLALCQWACTRVGAVSLYLGNIHSGVVR